MSAVRPGLMRAVRVAQFGGPEVLKVDHNVPIPQPAEGQVLVEVKASGINPVDTYVRSGTYALKPELPYTPGSDLAGTVKAVGPAVTRFKPGDRVYAVRSLSGSYAEYSVADQDMMGHLHDNLSFAEGAGIGIPCYTAYRAIIIKSRAEAGKSVLIHGASGAVGLACVQIAKAKGLKVYGTAGTQEGIDLVLKQGATAAFNHREEGYAEKITEATDGKGPDIIIEMLANVNLGTDLQLVNKNGIIVVVGNRGTVDINPRITMQKECIVTGLLLGNASQAEFMEMHSALAEGMKSGWLKPYIGKEYSLEEAPLAHDEVINSGKSLGKRVFKL